MQNDPVVSKASELLRLGLMPTPEEVEAGKVGLVALFFVSWVPDTTNAPGFALRRHCHGAFLDEATILTQVILGAMRMSVERKKAICNNSSFFQHFVPLFTRYLDGHVATRHAR